MSHPLQVQQLDGSITSAEGFGLKLIQHLPSKYIIPLWPTYYMPQNSQCTFSPTALKHFLKYPTIITYHLQALAIITPCNQKLTFPSILWLTSSKALDYHQFLIVCPTHWLSSLPIPTARVTTTLPLTRALLHQCLGHDSDHKLDLMCRQQTLLGLPKRPLPKPPHICPICVKAKL